jgi:hypothetical protein
LADLEENIINTARVFNIQPISEKFPNLLLSSDYGDDKIEFTSSMICKYPHKIELYDLLKVYAPPLIVSDYLLPFPKPFYQSQNVCTIAANSNTSTDTLMIFKINFKLRNRTYMLAVYVIAVLWDLLISQKREQFMRSS